MQLRYIELFHAVLTTGSLTAAARLLNISQPAASKALQHAEDQLGFALFSRVRGRLQPTEQALLLRHRIDRVMQDLQDLQRLTANMRRPASQPLRVVCTPALALALVPDALVELRKSQPDTAAELFTQHSAEMSASLALHEADIGLTLQHCTRHNLAQETLSQGRVMVIAPPGWWPEAELAQPLPIHALSDQPLIGITVRDALGNMLQGHMAQVDPMPQVSVWVQTYQLAYSLVAQGEGLALVDPFTAHSGGLGEVQIRPLEPQLDIMLYAVYRPDNPLNAIQRRFLEVICALANRIFDSPDAVTAARRDTPDLAKRA